MTVNARTWKVGGAKLAAAVIIFATASCRGIEESENPISHSLVSLGATAPTEQRSTSEELARFQFDDVPAPAGFSLRNHRNESYSYVFGGSRVGRFVYWGEGNEEDVAAEYLELMSKDPYNWTLTTEGSSGEGLPFVLEKPGQRCEVRLDRPRPVRGPGLLITISVEST